ncbi:MAG: histidine phosphatase family protein, partial [Myxococcota bacterium]
MREGIAVMDLYLIRHAIAEERRPGLEDPERQLTDEGKLRFERAVAGLQKLGVRFDRLYHSPWIRAAQTA